MAESVSILLNAEDKASKVINGVGNALKGMAEIAAGVVVAGAAAAGAAIAGIGAAGIKAVNAFAESELVSARMEAQLDALGKTAKVSSGDIERLATELSKVSGFDDEDLISAQTTLLRFGNLSRAQFEQATRAGADLAAMTGMDVASAFQYLGLSLEDPTQGFGRLKRYIGDLTAAQEEQIKKAMEAGDVAKAQGIVLDALAQKTAGAAARIGQTWIGQMNKLKTRWGNFWEDLGAEIVPFLGDWLDAINDWFNNLTDPILKFVKSEQFSKWMQGIYDFFFDRLIPSIQEFGQRIYGTFNLAIRIAGRFISEILIPALRRLWLWLQKEIPPTIKMVADFFTGKLLPAVQTVLQWIETTGLTYLRNLWDWLKQKIPDALQTVRLFFYNTLKPAIDSAWKWIKEILIPAVIDAADWLKNKIPDAIATVKQWFDEHLAKAIENVWKWTNEELIPALIDTYNWFKDELPGAIETYKTELELLGDAFKSIGEVLALFKSNNEEGQKSLGDTITGILDKIKQQFDFIKMQIDFFLISVRDTMTLIKSIFAGDTDAMLTALLTWSNNMQTGIMNMLKAFLSLFMDTSWWPELEPLGKDMIDGIVSGWRTNWDSLWSVINGDLTGLITKIRDLLGIKSPSKVFADMVGKPMAQGIQVGFDQQLSGAAGPISNSLTPANFSSGRGSTVINVNVSPTISTASPAEFERIVPYIDQAMRRVGRRR